MVVRLVRNGCIVGCASMLPRSEGDPPRDSAGSRSRLEVRHVWNGAGRRLVGGRRRTCIAGSLARGGVDGADRTSGRTRARPVRDWLAHKVPIKCDYSRQELGEDASERTIQPQPNALFLSRNQQQASQYHLHKATGTETTSP